jgi:cytochrome P450
MVIRLVSNNDSLEIVNKHQHQSTVETLPPTTVTTLLTFGTLSQIRSRPHGALGSKGSAAAKHGYSASRNPNILGILGGDLAGTSDPPVHTRLRRPVSRDFTPRRIREIEPRIRGITAQLLDAVQRKGELEVMADLANPLPVMVIAEMLGVPPERYQTFKRESDIIVSSDNTAPGTPLPAAFHEAVDSVRGYIADEIGRRRHKPGTDLLSALVAAHDEAESLRAEELLVFVVLLLLAGNETTTNLIGNGMLALGRDQQQIELLHRSPELMPRAIEESLRYDGPVQATFRLAVEKTNLGGTDIEPGTGCFIMLAAANRDPAQFPNPDQFDVLRDPNPSNYCFRST